MANTKPANYSHSVNFPLLLVELSSSLLVTTYQAGQVCSFGTHKGQLHVALEPFSVAMALALHPRKVAIGARGLIWFLESGGRDLAQSLAPAGRYDAALLTRSAAERLTHRRNLGRAASRNRPGIHVPNSKIEKPKS